MVAGLNGQGTVVAESCRVVTVGVYDVERHTTQFDFEQFVCKEEQSDDRPKAPPGDKGKRRRGDRDGGPEDDEPLDLPSVSAKGVSTRGSAFA